MEKENLHLSNLQDWQSEFFTIYGKKNSERTPTQLWLGLVRHVSKVAEEVRKGNLGTTLQEEIAYTFCWFMGFINWCNISQKDPKFILHNDLEQIIWNKYPGVCPVCGETKCICPAQRSYIEQLSKEERKNHRKLVEKKLALKRLQKKDEAFTLIQWKEMIRDIFTESIFSSDMGEICFHLLEEIGEVAQEIFILETIPNENKSDINSHIGKLENELADVFSWLMALVNKVQSYYVMMHKFEDLYEFKSEKLSQVEIPDIIWNQYFDEELGQLGCQHCKQRECSCTYEDLKE